ncbi:MBL fold metallo-hydrolase [Geoglobus acetivorans]|uniref:Metallo-beta-lactamase domain-containing protein 1 n=1 Tax=Geoglobus acetivorans TaxID=565033 RepID=A0ABZ3H6A8_GEOAI|nr:MBL fold metallo-hydrolase [Geoglobus acetivorans]
MAAKTVKIIKRGTVTVEAFEDPQKAPALKKLSGVGGGSTVTLIESDAKILVDTGFDCEWNPSKYNIMKNEKVLSFALKNFGLKSEDVDIVFITHWHRDHYGNLRLFENCEIVTSKPAVERHGLDFTGARDGKRIADGVWVMYTPGHTVDHASLILETEKMRYTEKGGFGGQIVGIGSVRIAIAGDAVVSESYYLLGKVWRYNQDFYSEKEAMESVRKIESTADYIISGHGGMFAIHRANATTTENE